MNSSRVHLILASASPRRKELLRKAGYQFCILPSRVVESHPKALSPSQLVQRLAFKKARAVAKNRPRDVVLGADTIVYLRGRVIGKPRDRKHARVILSQLSGAWQKVYTGVAVVWEGGKKKKVGVAVSRVKLRPLTDDDIKRASLQHLDKAGAYAVQEKKDPFVEKIIGDYDNVVGLPMALVKRFLRLTGQTFAKFV